MSDRADRLSLNASATLLLGMPVGEAAAGMSRDSSCLGRVAFPCQPTCLFQMWMNACLNRPVLVKGSCRTATPRERGRAFWTMA
jgi:hypothetical protein